jgi:hypothetical protein
MLKKIFISSFIFTSILYATPSTESNSILNYIKEQNGIKLTKEEEYTNFIKKELLKTFEFYSKNKFLNKVEESYFSSINKINSISSFSDIFKIENHQFYINTSLGKKELFALSDLIFKISIENKDLDFLKFYLQNTNSANFNYDFKSLEFKEAREKYQLIIHFLEQRKDLLINFVEFNKSQKNYFSSLENSILFGNYYFIYSLKNNFPDFNFNYKDYLYLIKNEKKLKETANNFYTFYKDNLDLDISKNRIIKDNLSIISNEPFLYIEKFNLSNFYVINYDIEIPLVNLLLLATNDNYFSFEEFSLDKNFSEEDIKNLYFNFYKIEQNKINLSNISFFIISYNKGIFYRSFVKEEFLNRFKKYF